MESLQEINSLSITLRLGLAILFGGIIGMNRGKKRMPAGFRTHILVCMGAALTMITNQYIFQELGGQDPSRMGAQVISGIGFLGAGTIIVTGRNKVKGLTTAASLWASGCMGLAIGIGLYSGAIIACIYMLFIISVLQRLDTFLLRKSRVMTLYIEFKKVEHVSAFLCILRQRQIEVIDLDISHMQEKGGQEVVAVLSVQLPRHSSHEQVIEELGYYTGVRYIQEL